MKTINNPTFYGQTVSDYGFENGKVDYRALANSFNHVLCNDLAPTVGWEKFEQVLGWVDNSEEISELAEQRDELADKLSDLTDELIDLQEDYENADEAVSRCEDASEAIEDVGYYIRQLNNYDEADESDADYAIDYLLDYLRDFRNEAEEQVDQKQKEVDKLTEKVDGLTEKIEALEEEQNEANDAEVFQWYIIDECGYNVMKYHAPTELVWCCEELDIYLWGVTHWGTAWDYVLTDIECEKKPTEVEEEPTEDEATPTAEANTAEADEQNEGN